MEHVHACRVGARPSAPARTPNRSSDLSSVNRNGSASGSGSPPWTSDVPVHRVAERAQQKSQRAIEVVAVSAPALERYAPRRLRWIERQLGQCREVAIWVTMNVATEVPGEHRSSRVA